MILNIIIYLALGALAGWLAGMLMKSKGGWIFNIILGIIGSFVGSWVGSLLGIGGSPLSSSFNVMSIITAVLGACLVIAIVRLITKKK